MANVALIPGVFSREIDQSQFSVLASETIFAVQGVATKGEPDTEIIVAGRPRLTALVGPPKDTLGTFAIYAGQQFLEQANILKFVRVTDGTETKATTGALIPCAASAAQIIGTIDLSNGVNLSQLNMINLDIDGGGAVDIDISAGAANVNNVQILEIVSAINTAAAAVVASVDQTGRFLVLKSTTTGAGSTVDLAVPASDNATAIVMGTQVRTPPSGVLLDLILPFNATGVAAGAGPAFTVEGASAGTHANNKGVRLEAGTRTGTLKVTVIDTQGNQVSDPLDNLFIDTTLLDVLSGDRNVSTDVAVDPTSIPATVCFPVFGDYYLSGGTDGITGVADADFIRAQDVLADPLTVDMNVMATPGISSAPVVQNGLAISRQRADTIFIVDPPVGLDVAGVIDYHNGTGAYSGVHPAFNSSYGALYWPWVEWFDTDNGIRLFTPPCGWVAGQYAFTDRETAPWFAPAGVNRGVLEKGLRVEQKVSLADRILLRTSGNNVNVILNIPGTGITIFDQKTLQRTNSATNRVNARRLLLYAEKTIASSVNAVVFEPADPATRRRLTGLINPIFRDIAARRGLNRFEVNFSDQVNGPEVQEQNRIVGKLFVDITRTGETIDLDFIITRVGAEFNEENI